MFGSNPNDVTMLATYADAVRWESEVKPIRGRAVECKPLGARNKSHANIRKDGKDIVVRLYNTDIVRYKPDNTIIINQGGYSSQTTRKYLNAVLPMWFGSHQDMTTVWRGADGNLLLHSNGDNEFKPISNSVSEAKFYFVNPKPCVIHTKNRAKSKRVRAQYAPFINYVRRIRKLMGGDITTNSRDAAHPYLSSTDMLSLALTKDPENHLVVMNHLARWHGWGCKPDVLNLFEEVMFSIHRDEMLDAITLPRGEMKHDRFKRFF